ncbi:calmodulin-domain kinase (macronuclear) [Tetrahymena thermophila SB210]|uniref:non-specific serine/threonine protein kinase n=1 Tax=Tetrahymena thermophila (strain SB210) TaxID=312017 RepID=W7X3W9_TETTS|nr:calmodulin-domain kinase [Tetrahymena thermophila SB210]EWS71123.1 calmodulin-domain kinase [Tetrahymena thermophila SB210]|eukprot:XP_012656331.1 calmodulin-domain kinase [Tetrahymena thermophila SB210]
MKTRSQDKKLGTASPNQKSQSQKDKKNEENNDEQHLKQSANKNLTQSNKKQKNSSQNNTKIESIVKSPNLGSQLKPENTSKYLSSTSKSPQAKSPQPKSPAQNGALAANSLDNFHLDNNHNQSEIKEKRVEDIKIDLGSFIQKKETNIDEYLSQFDDKIKLGTGHYSEVYKIKDKLKDVYRAMKIINKKKIPFNEKESFLREIKILKKLDHPNILKLYEFLEDSDNYYLITEFCEGKELFDVIQDNCENLTEKDIASIVQQILQSLAYAHSNKIMHRDIKPENIMVQTDKNNNYIIKLVDWGIGSDFGSNDSTLNQKCGTPYYAAPEVIKKKYNEKCDIWSTGVILYTLLVSEIPFGGDSTTDIILNVLKGKYDLKGQEWNKVSDEAKDLVQKMLNYEYENRISAEEALQHPWFKQINQKLSKQVLKVNLSKLKLFQAQSQLQRAAMSFIVSHLISEKEKEEFSQTFKQLDENGDGQLSKAEIMNGYKKVFGKNISEEEVNKIFDQIDVNQSGFIDYTEFITAVIDDSVFIEDEKLRKAFSLFDKDGDGYITQQEIQNVLGVGMDFDSETWTKIVAEVDENGDGQVSFEEFKKIMQTLVKQETSQKRKQQKKKSLVMEDEKQS